MRHDEARPRKRRRPPTRRKTVRWSQTEVEALLAGVRLHGVGKWATILRHSKVFNGVRTSVDLKDKWRNLPSPARAAALAATCASICASDTNGTIEQSSLQQQQGDHVQQQEHPLVPSSPAQSRSQTPEGDHVEESGSVSETERHTSASEKPSQSTTQRGTDGSMEDTSTPATPVMNQHISVPDFATPTLTANGIPKNATTSVAPVPLAPSESSVSPEALPTAQITTHTPSTTIGTPAVYPPHPSPFASPYPGGINPVHVHTPQHVIQQGLYQSAAALAAYWRSLGHEPDPYAIAAALTGGSASAFYGGGVEAPGNVEEDDDDDDDDEDDPTDIAPFSTSALEVKGPMPVPFASPYTNPFQTLSPMLHSGIIAPTPTPNLAIPTATSGQINAPRDESESEDDIGSHEADGIENENEMPIASNNSDDVNVQSNLNSDVQGEVNENQKGKTVGNLDNENTNAEKEVLLLSGEEEPANTNRDEMDVDRNNTGAGESFFSVHDFPEKGRKDTDKTENSDEDLSGSNSLEINSMGFPPNTGVSTSYSATDY